MIIQYNADFYKIQHNIMSGRYEISENIAKIFEQIKIKIYIRLKHRQLNICSFNYHEGSTSIKSLSLTI